MVRRIPDLNLQARNMGRMFNVWQFLALFNTTDYDVPDRGHRGHAIVEQVHANLKTPRSHACRQDTPAVPDWNSRSVRSTSPAPPVPLLDNGWPGTTTATIRRTLVSAPARIASSARRLTLYLPLDWLWEVEWTPAVRLYPAT
ncbi:hypothetical protein P3H15_39915 [Rhodococcus sp. T2V]|uniref:hypothetical protein n=1 Tax=Rhodococcus sp. T2V TaxID=3034164 RepID=UPI0023E2A831|nr:hypothetical protein [Rhodococcus sp. T2V]MDF3311166.1 hypothetical protein [Rhodococcus sp. T2V]